MIRKRKNPGVRSQKTEEKKSKKIDRINKIYKILILSMYVTR